MGNIILIKVDGGILADGFGRRRGFESGYF